MTHRLVIGSPGGGTLIHDDECAPATRPSGRPTLPGEGTLRCDFAQAFLRTRITWSPGTYEVEIDEFGELRVLRVVV